MIKVDKQATTHQAFRDIKAKEEVAQAQKTKRLKANRLRHEALQKATGSDSTERPKIK
jgi:hypothetical protein